jgi:hypothetical protein
MGMAREGMGRMDPVGRRRGWGKARNIICKKRPERPDADRHTYLMFDETPICIGLVPIVCA